jgi:colicin import membrane protein
MARTKAVEGQEVAAVESDKPKKKAAKKRSKKIVPKKDAESAASKAKADKAAKDKAAKTKAAKAKAAKERAAKAKTGDSESKPTSVETDPFQVAKQTMKDSVPAIVKTMVRKAKEGSCTHAKTLLEMTGAKRMFDGEAPGQDSGEPWAKLVLERLDEAECATEQEGAERESSVVQS